MNFLRNHWKCVRCVESCERYARLKAGRQVCQRNATTTSRKLKGSYISGRECRSEWEKTYVWVQKAADGSACKLWYHCIVPKVCNLTSHEESEELQELATVQGQAKLNRNPKKSSSDVRVI